MPKSAYSLPGSANRRRICRIQGSWRLHFKQERSMTRLDPSLETNQRKMKALLIELTTGEGSRPTIVDGVKLSRANCNFPRTPVLYEPSIYVIASGRKKGYIGDRRVIYDENNYLVLSVPLPFECETEVGDGEPFLGVSIRMEMSLISELAIQMDVRSTYATADADACIRATPLDARMREAIVRLVECWRSPGDAGGAGPR